jgi:hypothetical protein
MTMSEGLALAGASALAGLADVPMDTASILTMDVSDLLDDELVVRIRATFAIQALAGLLRAKYLREIRDRNFPVTGGCGGQAGVSGNPATRKGWSQWLKVTFGIEETAKATREILALEHLEAAYRALPPGETDDSHSARAHHGNLPELSSRALQELGAGNGVGSKVAGRLLSGEIPGNSVAIRAAVKEAKEAERLAGIKDIKPAAPKAAARPMSPKGLPMAPPPEGITFSLARYREADETTTEMEWYVAHTEKMRKAAVAYRNTCKQLEDRLAKGIADHRHLPAVMTVRQIIWKERDFDLGAAFDAVTVELNEATRLWGLAMPLCNGPAKITE